MEYQRERNNHILRLFNHEMHLQEIKKSLLSIFVDKRCYMKEMKLKVYHGINIIKCFESKRKN